MDVITFASLIAAEEHDADYESSEMGDSEPESVESDQVLEEKLQALDVEDKEEDKQSTIEEGAEDMCDH